ncbi:hypothetical protein KSP40_PGU021445 [Platanthera guangdongensis]|uniref:Uncharacterized protein n=1 Tax=Platanthera guangdongensis TaxID=2320717 RepID=A0ABR2LYV3_9ASPA
MDLWTSCIQFASIAFRKEQTSQEKLLNDKLNTYKDVFFQELRKRSPARFSAIRLLPVKLLDCF